MARLGICLSCLLFMIAATFPSQVWSEETVANGTISQLKELSEKGDAAAQYQLAMCYETGRGIKRDDTQAVYWLTKSAELGNANAQIRLSGRYQDGLGVKKDETIAIAWLRRAALQDNLWAQTNLGLTLLQKLDVKEDLEAAVVWLLVAAERGDLTAQIRLAQCYSDGVGVSKNLMIAAKWCYIAQLNNEREKTGHKRKAVPPADEQAQPVQPESGSGLPEVGSAPALIVVGKRNYERIAEQIIKLELKMNQQEISEAKQKASDWFAR